MHLALVKFIRNFLNKVLTSDFLKHVKWTWARMLLQTACLASISDHMQSTLLL